MVRRFEGGIEMRDMYAMQVARLVRWLMESRTHNLLEVRIGSVWGTYSFVVDSGDSECIRLEYLAKDGSLRGLDEQSEYYGRYMHLDR